MAPKGTPNTGKGTTTPGADRETGSPRPRPKPKPKPRPTPKPKGR